MSENVIELHPKGRRSRWNPFAPSGERKHARTPETWAAMVEERDALRARVRQLEQEVSRVDQLEEGNKVLTRQIRAMGQEIRRMQALMGGGGADQQNVTLVPPHTGDPEDTQPISKAELFADDPFKAMRPKVRVHAFPTGNPTGPEHVPPDPVTQLLSRVVPPNPEMVQDVDETRVMALWERAQRTA